MIDIKAHDDDINVIAWNPIVSYLMVSGSDDGSFKIWDFRRFKAETPAAHFKWHSGPITSIDWHPVDDSIIAVSAAGALHSPPDACVQSPCAYQPKRGLPLRGRLPWPTVCTTLCALADNQISIWDLSVEADDNAQVEFGQNKVTVPPQLLFLHQGQKDPKEVQWHRQLPGVLFSTGSDGFSIFKPSNL